MVFFEAPHRTSAALAAMAEAFGPDRPAAVCRELTKTHEEVARGGLGELVTWSEAGVRGEVTVVVAGHSGRAGALGPEELAGLVAEQEATGLTRKVAIKAVAQRHGVPRRTVYDAAHGLAGSPPGPAEDPTGGR